MSKQPSVPTVKKLFALSGNTCAFPSCPIPLIDPESGVIIGEVCHIKAREEGGPRYDLTQTETERNGCENLVLMCSVHHKVIDTAIDSYPVERLQEIKRVHEAKHTNGLPPSDEVAEKLLGNTTIAGSVIANINQQGGQVAHQINNSNYYQQPRPKPVVLTPVVTHQLSKVDHEAGLDYYDLRIELHNDGTKTVREFCINVEIPVPYMENAGTYAAQVESPTPSLTKMFRHTQQHFSSPMNPYSLFPNAKQTVFTISFIIKKQHYFEGVSGLINIKLYTEDELVYDENHPIADMLNPERVQHFLGNG